MGATGIASLDTLEKKITKAAELINRLRSEKNEAEAENKELKEKMQSLYIRNEELSKEVQALKKGTKKDSSFEKTREELAHKIEEMLAKLEGFSF
jgi:uncharacterized coiled-coil DUF342 family protein